MTAVPSGDAIHPFLKGNFAPVTEEFVSHPCDVQGQIPEELLGGQYIRNGGNPVYPPEQGRHYHWFDGDGMLHGVFFPPDRNSQPLYTNRHLATPLLTMTLLLLRSPIPSIALLISPLSSLHRIVIAIIQAFFIALRARMGVLSVANTSVIWWGKGLGSEAAEEDMVEDSVDEILTGEAKQGDHRLLATCESGPPLEVRVPELETVGWDRLPDSDGEDLGVRRGKWEWWKRLGLSRVQEMARSYSTRLRCLTPRMCDILSSIGRASMLYGRRELTWDVPRSTRTHTILLNLPLTLAPHNLFSRHPVPLIHFDRTLPSEFVIFPRLLRTPETPQEPIRFQEPEPSLIFHTANAWDEYSSEELVAVNMLACRFKSAKLVYAAGAVDIPKVEKQFGTDDVVRLHYYRFAMRDGGITHSFPLTVIPFEFPSLPHDRSMSAAKFVYGCTMRSGSFDERLGGAAKVDCIVKIDVEELIRRGRARGEGKNMIPVDGRSSAEILSDWERGISGPVQIFALPEGWYAQETQFVARAHGSTEDDGYLLSPDGTPSTASDAGSELLHGTFVHASRIRQQRILPQPLPPQELLQDKLARSRMQHFVSILFNRPTERDKSKIEKAVLAIMWPAAFGMLALALLETGGHVLGSFFEGSSVRRSSADLWPWLLLVFITFIFQHRSRPPPIL
ncbi:hypothetical protein CI109_100348 [Kwoniella shandongensis]|uniref:Carotenoid oxygenase n=1 Tax=Kwoniella shandongensis TaxID=1734106 RepID=A0AAJ8LFI4_9TREE